MDVVGLFFKTHETNVPSVCRQLLLKECRCIYYTHWDCPMMPPSHREDLVGHNMQKDARETRVLLDNESVHRSRTNPSLEYANSPTKRRVKASYRLQTRHSVQMRRVNRTSQLTPNLAFLSEHPIVLPKLPYPLRARPTLARPVILALDCRHHRGW